MNTRRWRSKWEQWRGLDYEGGQQLALRKKNYRTRNKGRMTVDNWLTIVWAAPHKLLHLTCIIITLFLFFNFHFKYILSNGARRRRMKQKHKEQEGFETTELRLQEQK